VWALAFQMAQYFEDGAGRDAFGAEQPLARKGALDILADTDAVVRGLTSQQEVFGRARVRTEAWARTHPIDRTFSSRASVDVLMAELRAEGQDAFEAVGAAADTIENVSQRLNTYAELLPRQSRWQAELLIDEAVGERSVEGALDDINAIGAAARNADGLIDDTQSVLGTAAQSMRETLAAERRAVLEGLDVQRVQTLAYMTAERLAVLERLREERIGLVEALRQERVAVIDAVRQERIAGLTEVDEIKTRAVNASVAGLRELVDYTLWRVAVLLVILMLLALVVGVIGYRLTLGRRLPSQGA